jgi:hypothetical protein
MTTYRSWIVLWRATSSALILLLVDFFGDIAGSNCKTGFFGNYIKKLDDVSSSGVRNREDNVENIGLPVRADGI